MKRFSFRNGYQEEDILQFEKISSNLRYRLYNIFVNLFERNNQYYIRVMDYVFDKFGYPKVPKDPKFQSVFLSESDLKQLNQFFKDSKWWQIYDFIEIFLEKVKNECSECECEYSSCADCYLNNTDFENCFNCVLEEEKSAYRIVNSLVVPITNEYEISLLNEGMSTDYKSVNIHIEKAIKLYSDRQSPDYENSIKESISAVESICCIITGLSGKEATLVNAIKRLKENGVIIHSAMEQAFHKLYGYTSDENGIRHGGIDFKNAPAEDAKYMVLSCSSFISYLIEKISKVQLD